MNNMEDFKDTLLPRVKKIAPRTIGMDLKPFNPNNPEHVKEWRDTQRKMFEKVKEDFDEKGIPFPSIAIDTTPRPITYGIKTTDENGNVIHSQP